MSGVRKRLVVGVTGASGPQLAARLLLATSRMPEVETHLIVSHSARRTVGLELDPSCLTLTSLSDLADVTYQPNDIAAAVASGSFATMGMVIIPCSMKTLGGIASGYAEGLVARAADVTLKERRPLVLVTREMPLNLMHIRNMETVTLAGATVLPPVVGFYDNPNDINALLDHIVGRVLDQFGIDADLFPRWSSP